MAPKKRPSMESSAIVTRSGKANLVADSDPQSPTIGTRRSSRKMDSGSDSQPPKTKKPKANTSNGGGGASSSVASKKKANKESAAIITRSSTRQRGKAKIDSDPEPPKLKKARKNTSDDGGTSSSSMATRSSNRILNSPLGVAGKPKFKKPKTSPKKRANVESSSAVVTRSGKGKAKMGSKLPSANTSDAVKKRANVDPSGRCEKGKAKMENVETSIIVLSRCAKGKAKEDDTSLAPKSKGKGNALSSPAPKEKVYVQTSGVLTRRNKAKMDSDPVPLADPQPPKSKKAERTTSTSMSTHRGKAKRDSELTPPADPHPPKSNIGKGKTTTYTRVSRSS